MSTFAFLFCDAASLELRVIQEILHRHRVAILNMSYPLAHYDDEVLGRYLREILDTTPHVFIMPDMPTERLTSLGLLHEFTKLDSKMAPNGMSVLSMVCAIVGHRPNRYERLVSIFATGHIAGLRQYGATNEEILELALRDRLLRGGSMKDEMTVKAIIQKSTIVHSEFGRYATYAINGYYYPPIHRSVIDHIIYGTESFAGMVFLFVGYNNIKIYYADSGDKPTAWSKCTLGYGTFSKSTAYEIPGIKTVEFYSNEMEDHLEDAVQNILAFWIKTH